MNVNIVYNLHELSDRISDQLGDAMPPKSLTNPADESRVLVNADFLSRLSNCMNQFYVNRVVNDVSDIAVGICEDGLMLDGFNDHPPWLTDDECANEDQMLSLAMVAIGFEIEELTKQYFNCFITSSCANGCLVIGVSDEKLTG